MQFFLDANVLFSACITPTGRSAALIALGDHGLCEIMTSAHAADEARRNLEARYQKTAPRLQTILRGMRILPEAPADTVADVQRRYSLPAEDAPVLAAAIAGKSDAFVTGDRTHFGALFGKKVDGVKVLSLREALAALLQSRGH